MKNDFLSLAREVASTLNAAVSSGGITWHQAAKVAADYNDALTASGAEGVVRGGLYAEHRTKQIEPLFLVQTRNLANLSRKAAGVYTV